MKVALIGLKGQFDAIDLSKIGTRSLDKIVTELYNGLSNFNKRDFVLDKIELKQIKAIGPAF